MRSNDRIRVATPNTRVSRGEQAELVRVEEIAVRVEEVADMSEVATCRFHLFLSKQTRIVLWDTNLTSTCKAIEIKIMMMTQMKARVAKIMSLIKAMV